MKDLLITIKTPFGFEKPLEEELNELGYDKITLLNRAVQLKGNWEDVYRLNYHTRLAISVLVEVKSFTIHNEKDLYEQAKKIDWTSYFDVDKTFAVKGAVFSTLFQHSQYPLLVVKDAIADTFREKFGKRPDVNVKSPQVMFDVYIKDKSVIISLNTSGVPLFQRGYRQETGEAPINEVLAAGLLRLSGWDRKSTLIDPMCGSGTIAIEAALWAANIPALIERSHYAFKNFTSFDAKAWEKVLDEGNKRPIDLGFEILASDIDAEMVQKAKRNSKMAPIGNMITFDRKDVLTLTPPNDNGVLICNPPYEERMGENVEELYEGLGDTFKNSFVGYSCWIISSNIDALKHVGLKPSQKFKVFNGSLECSFRQYQIFSGFRKENIINDLDSTENDDVQVIEKKDAQPVERKTSRPIRRRDPQPVDNEDAQEAKEKAPKPSAEKEPLPIEKEELKATEKKAPKPSAGKYAQAKEGKYAQPTEKDDFQATEEKTPKPSAGKYAQSKEELDPRPTEKEEFKAPEKKASKPSAGKYSQAKEGKYAQPIKKEDSQETKEKEPKPTEQDNVQATQQLEKEKTVPEKPKAQEKKASKYQKNPSYLKYASSSSEKEEVDKIKEESKPTEETESLKEKITKLKKDRESEGE